MNIIEAYERSIAQKNKQIRKSLAAKRANLTDKKKRIRSEAEDSMRLAYGESMQKAAIKGQQARAAGRQGGAEQNAVGGVLAAHRTAQQSRVATMNRSLSAVDSDIALAEAQAQKSIADNQTALTFKKDQQKIKDEQAAAKAAEKAAKTAKTTTKKSSSSYKSSSLSKAQVLSLMRSGIYDEKFAGILGLSDQQVRDFIKNNQKSTKEEEVVYRLPGTYKPHLK